MILMQCCFIWMIEEEQNEIVQKVDDETNVVSFLKFSKGKKSNGEIKHGNWDFGD